MNKVKRRKKFSLKKTLRIIIPLILIIVIIINKNNILYFCQSKITNYDVDKIKIFHNLDAYNEIKKHKHSDTLDKIMDTNYFNKEYINYYLNINYQENIDFSSINELIKLGYNANDINTINEKLTKDDITILLDNDYLKDIVNILNLSYFKKDNLKRYLQYSKNNDINYQDVITYVNIGIDQDYYTNVSKITDTNSIDILVNKYNVLDSKYVPNDLTAISNKYNKGANNLMRKDAKEAFEKMCEAALKDNIKIYSGSAYRSYNYQLNLYNRYVTADGKKKADTYAARAGHSEHQTGLATDIMNAKAEYISKSDKEYTWLVNNSYKYGFILRYPKDSEDITGYMYEEWHFRYLGIELANKVYASKLTYDEYVARK